MKKYNASYVRGVLDTLAAENIPLDSQEDLQALGTLTPDLLDFIKEGMKKQGWDLKSIASFVSQNGQADPVALIKGLRLLSRSLDVKIITDVPSKEMTPKKKEKKAKKKKGKKKKTRKKFERVSPEEWERRRKLINKHYWEEELTHIETAEKMGVSKDTLYCWMVQLGIRRRSRKEAIALKKKKEKGDAGEG